MRLLPRQYKFLENEKSPKILVEMLNLYGTEEFFGDENNPVILNWAVEIRDFVGIEYKADVTPWCGLCLGVAVHRAGYEPPFLCIRAKEWLKFGSAQKVPMLGDILVFNRAGGGHVGVYVGEDSHCYHVLGGNQSDRVSIARLVKNRMVGCRRPVWKIGKPNNVRRIVLDSPSQISHNES